MRIAITSSVRLFVDVEGPGLVPEGPGLKAKPSLVLLHGGPGFDHSGFKPAFSRLADVAQVVYYDHRRHGRSDRCTPEERTLDVLADDVVRLCDALGIEKPIVLGQSFGGFVAQRYLARHPQHPAKVILSSTLPAIRLDRAIAMFDRLGGPAAASAWWNTPTVDTRAMYATLCLPLYNQRPPTDPYAAKRTLFDLDILIGFVRGECRTMDLLPGLAHVRCPVLVMAGELDPVCSAVGAREIAAAILAPWSRLAVFDRSGHGAWRDEPEAAFAVLRDFIVNAT